ncbi:MAG TPA: hypothetical protein VFH54_11220, partial [Mycobacteriales bacterium]|nr:hypothetical protein [Mycobacteriales bacterium]
PQPRPTDVSYDAYCAGKNTDKTYRVLLVVDYGTESGAPSGPVYSCYGFNDDDNGFQVLTQQHTERDNSGLICAIDSYPRTGCGNTVSSPDPTKTPARATPTSTIKTSTTAMTTTRSSPSTQPSATQTVTTLPRRRTSVSPTTPGPTTTSQSPTTGATSTQATLHPFTAPAAASRSTFPTGLVVALVALAGLGGGAWFLCRRAR